MSTSAGAERRPLLSQDGVALLLDLVAVAVFAAIGRASHEESLAVSGLAGTAWPCTAGLLLGHLLTRLLLGVGRAGSLRGGLVVWPATVVVGMLLRHLTDAGTAWSFVVVASLFLGVFLLGWRLVAAKRRSQPVP